jgi:glyoxylase-like metal-dependent hydrolase (beta-lactamase superfamily II)
MYTTGTKSRYWMFIVAVMVVTIGLTTPVYTSGYPPVNVDMQARQVSQHVYYVQGVPRVATANAGFVSNSSFVVTEQGVVVFDTLGTPSLGAKLLEVIREITEKPIVRVYISHYHADHMYGNQIFHDLGAEIVAPEGAVRYLSGDDSQRRLKERKISLTPWVNESTRVIHPDRYLYSEEVFTLGGVTMRAVNVGSAHSDGDMILFVESDSVLLSGDIIFENRIPFLGSSNTREWLEVLDQLADSDATTIIPGHGPAAGDPGKIVSLTRRYLSYVRQVMATAVEEWVPFDEAYENADWTDFIDYPAFIEANRQNAYGVYLSMEQESLE